jgi:hypothetical protein
MNLDQVKEISLKIFKSYKDEILSEYDWFFNLDDWTLNYVSEDDSIIEVHAYEVINNETQWEKHHWLGDIQVKEITA